MLVVDKYSDRRGEYFETRMCNETRTIENLKLRLTHFGWTASGAVPKPSQQFCVFTTNEN